MSKKCCGIIYSDEDKVCEVCGKSLDKKNNKKNSKKKRHNKIDNRYLSDLEIDENNYQNKIKNNRKKSRYEELDEPDYDNLEENEEPEFEETEESYYEETLENEEPEFEETEESYYEETLENEEPEFEETEESYYEETVENEEPEYEETIENEGSEDGEPEYEEVEESYYEENEDVALEELEEDEDKTVEDSISESVKKQIAREAILDQIYDDNGFKKDDKIKEKKKRTPFKALGIISLVIAFIGIILIGVLVYFIILNPYYIKTGAANEVIVYPELSEVYDERITPIEYNQATTTDALDSISDMGSLDDAGTTETDNSEMENANVDNEDELTN